MVAVKAEKQVGSKIELPDYVKHPEKANEASEVVELVEVLASKTQRKEALAGQTAAATVQTVATQAYQMEAAKIWSITLQARHLE